MAGLRTVGSRIKTLDTRALKPKPKRADAELQTPAYRQWAEAVKARAGYRCEWVDDSKRCEVKAPARLFADHRIERRDGGALLDLGNGQCLCGSHHTRKTMAARAARMSERF